MTTIGTLDWAHATGGAITPSDEAVLAEQIAYIVEQASLPARHASVDIEELAPPRSALTRDVDRLWDDCAPPWLHAHGHRTWYDAATLDRVWQLGADLELLYAATLLHDLGLTADHAPTPAQPCFAVSGALGARPVVAHHRPHDADVVVEAIAMHLNLRIDVDNPVHQLVPAGTLIDVTGLRLQLLPAQLVTAVNTLHPRGTFGRDVGRALAERASAYPATRCGWLQRTLNVSELTGRHPLDQASEATP